MEPQGQTAPRSPAPTLETVPRVIAFGYALRPDFLADP
jgi:hypothetical protein